MNESTIEPQKTVSKHPEGVRYSPTGFTVAALLSLLFLYQIVGGGLTWLASGGNFTEDNVTLGRISTMLAQILFLLLPTLWLLKRQHGSINKAVAWRMPEFNELFLAIVGMIALLQVAEGYVYFQDKIPLPETWKPFLDSMKKMVDETYRVLVSTHSIPELIVVLIVVALTPAICEEILFRGLVQKNLTLSSNAVSGFVMTGIIFGLYHFNIFLTVPLVALGIYFSFLRYRSKSIIVPMTAHFLNNGVSVISAYVYGYDQSDFSSMMGDDTSASLVLSTTILFAVIFLLIMWMYVKATEKHEHQPESNIL